MGNLGFIAGKSSDDYIDELGDGGEVDFGEIVEMNGFSGSVVYTTPNDVFTLLLEKGHSDEGNGGDLRQKYIGVVNNLLNGSSLDETVRFARLVVGAKDYLSQVLGIREYQSGDVGGTMGVLRKKYSHVLTVPQGEQGEQAEELMDTTEDLLDGLSFEESDLDLEKFYSTVVAFSFAVETVLFQSSGIEF